MYRRGWMLCDISVVFNSFADAFGLMCRKLSSECLFPFNRANPLAASNMPAVVHSCANIWSPRSAPSRLLPRPRTADYAWSVLARVLSVAKDRGLIAVNACERGGRLYETNRTEIIWTSVSSAVLRRSHSNSRCC
jgi:hypothetical protein